MRKKVLPTSPHLTIYKIQITTLLSILHRFSGIILFFSLIIIALGICCLFYMKVPGAIFSVLNERVARVAIFIMFFGLFSTFLYHLLNGIRFLYFDVTRRMSNQVITITGAVVVLLLVVAMLFIAIRS